MNLDTKIEQLNKVGKTVSSRLKRLGIFCVSDLLYHFPFRYEDYSNVVKIRDLKDGQMASIKGKIELINNKRSFRKKKIITEALVSDGDETLRIIWFGQPYISKNLHVGDEVFLSGKVKEDILGPQFVSPIYEKVNREKATTHTARLIPMYNLTSNITQKQIRFLVRQIIDLSENVEEYLPEKILEANDLSPISSALQGIHFPLDYNHLKQSTNRLKFDELFILQLKSEIARKNRKKAKAVLIDFKEKQIKNFVSNLPFVLTKAQKVCSWEILQDIGKDIPMNRLLSGDVGSGKTVVAAIPIYNSILNGYQCALMAPTEILAVQHFYSVEKLMGKQIKIALLTQSQIKITGYRFKAESKVGQKKEFLKLLKSGDIQLAIGTHALLSDGIDFNNLALVVVDEQHRFGVEQRKHIKEKGKHAHFLSMTATPIPRSLALMIYGELDISILNELPPNRVPVISRLVEKENRSKAYDFIKKQVSMGGQVFVVCPLIEDKEEGNIITEKKTVLNEYEKLSKTIYPDLRVEYIHGKMKSADKENIMNKFKNGDIDILVSTSVIEVGVDIPNATVMMIEGAERFGLAQLHQFRGRVGRSDKQSYCFLFVENQIPKAMQRLRFFETHNDGFKLAEKDLENRGPGEVYGKAQSGIVELKLAVLTDHETIKKARDAARDVVIDINKYPALLKKIVKWQNTHFE